MKKVAIVTLNGYYNYGNRLQNYAVQEVLKSLGFEVETLIYTPATTSHKPKTTSISTLISSIKVKLWKIKHQKRIKQLNQIREKHFQYFSNKYINEVKENLSYHSSLEHLNSKYDYFVTGSDQVWNPYYNGESAFYFLTFAPKHKRITFSPSFGIHTLPSSIIKKYQTYLNEFEYISIRENEGKKLIEELIQKEATVLVDPTLCLSASQWRSLATKPRAVPERYILTYFLGGIPSQYQDFILKISREHNLKVIHLANINDVDPYQTGPSEFLSFIDEAQVFLTDSFHGCVFSILFETPFVVFNRDHYQGSMFSRIETLLETFDLKHRIYSNLNLNELFTIDFTHTPNIIDAKIEEVKNFLQQSFHMNDEG